MAGGQLNLQGLVTQKALQQQISQAQKLSGGTDLNTMAHQAYLQAGIATGTLNPSSLSHADAVALGYAVAKPPPSSGGVVGGVLNGIGDAFGTVLKIAGSNAGDFARDVEGVPQGLVGLGEGVYNSVADKFNGFGVGGIQLPKLGTGQDLQSIGKSTIQGTVHDFANFSPYHALNPVLDAATLLSGGTTGAVRGAEALSRAGQVGGLGETLSKVVTDSKAIKALTKLGNPASRPPIPFYPGDESKLAEGAVLPPLPDRTYSISPARQLFLERPTDALFNSRLSQLQIPGAADGTTLQTLRSNFAARRYGNYGRGQMSSESLQHSSRATVPLVKAAIQMYKDAGSRGRWLDMHDAAQLSDMLGLWNKTEEDKMHALDQYIHQVLPLEHYEGAINNSEEAQAIRDLRMQKYNSDSFRRLVANPTESMKKYMQAWHDSAHNYQMALGINPNEILERSLGPAAHVFGKTTEELLREQPEQVQRTMNFARIAADLEQAVRSGDENAPELQYEPLLANQVPAGTLAQKQQLVKDAIESLKADVSGQSHELLNNAHAVGYLPGRTLSQKIGVGMRDRLGVSEPLAERYATGGMTNYFPMYSYVPGHHVDYADNMIQRRLNDLKGQRNAKAITTYKRSSPERLVRSTDLGLSPIDSFLKEADLHSFRAGVDVREPELLIRHVQQVERELVGRRLSARMVQDISLKDSQGLPVLVNSPDDLVGLFGSTKNSAHWAALPVATLRQLFESESQAAQKLAGVLEAAKGEALTPEMYRQIQAISDESAHNFVNQVIEQVNSNGNKMVVVPRAYVDNLIKHAKILDRAGRGGLLAKYQGFIHHWRSAVLAYMPSWLLRTSMGHGIVLFISGVGPADYARASKFFEDDTGTRLGRFSSRGSHEVPGGIEQGTMHEGLEATKRGPVSDFLLGNKIASTTTGAVHNIANWQRRAAFMHGLNKIAKARMADLRDTFQFKYPGAFHNEANIQEVIANHPDMVRNALNELHRVSYTFGQMSPWERRLAKNILPFWGWYKFISKFVWSMPITYPGRTLAITEIGNIGNSDMNALGPIPEWVRNSILLDTHNLGALRYLPMQGINPLADIMNPASGPEGIIRMGQTSPIIQAGLEAAGYNTMTGGSETIDPTSGIVNVNGRWIDVNTGQEYDTLGEASVGADIARFFGVLARSFPEVRIAELVNTGGKSVYPESIPFINEKVKPNSVAKSVSPLSILGQYTGIKPSTYNEAQNRNYLIQDLARARPKVYKAKAASK